MRRASGTAHGVFASVALGVALALTANEASAQPKLEIGFRSGYAVPFGEVDERPERPDDLDDYAIGQVPIWFDIGARIREDLFVGRFSGARHPRPEQGVLTKLNDHVES